MSSGLNDEFGTTSGLISSAASIRSASSSPPAIRAGQAGPRLGDLGVAQLGPQGRVEDAGGLGPDGRPAARRRGRRASRCALSDRSGHGGLEQRLAPARRAEVGRERGVDPRRRGRSNASCCAAAMAIAFSVVKSYWGGTAALAALRARRRSGRCCRSRSRAARRCRGSRAGRPSTCERLARAGCRHRGSRSARR